MPLSFNSDFKKDSGFLKPNFPKIFFGLMKPGDLGTASASETKLVSASRASEGKNVKVHHFSTLDFAILSRGVDSFLNPGCLAIV